MSNASIKQKLKEMLVKRLNLDVTPDEIDEDKPLFRSGDASAPEGLNLDSIEALEIVIGLERTFNVKIQGAEYKQEFYSVQTLANFVERLLANGTSAAVQPT
jgi:acyl carrier protein